MRSEPAASLAAAQLGGYLCGTYSARGRRVDLGAVASLHREVQAVGARPVELELAGEPWQPKGEAEPILTALRALAEREEIRDVVVFGSHARGTTTGFSDLDAFVVLEDRVAERQEELRRLRPHLLAAQRAVLAYQPMQHHGFEIVTPKLLRQADIALRMPASALAEAKPVLGREAVRCSFATTLEGGSDRFRAIARTLLALRAWPDHPWTLHRIVSMFELAPTLYLQARGATTPKWRSFDESRAQFPDTWWPYDRLRDVRAAWPREPRASLGRAGLLLRNPWLAIALWRRGPGRPPAAVAALLDDRLLGGLLALVRDMERRLP